jgi:hypothetical protein
VAKAMRNALGRWSAFSRYLDDDGLENDNNTAKRSIYGIALGRKFVPAYETPAVCAAKIITTG